VAHGKARDVIAIQLFHDILMLFNAFLLPINGLRMFEVLCDQTWQCTALVSGILSKSGSEVSAWLQGGTAEERKTHGTFQGNNGQQ